MRVTDSTKAGDEVNEEGRVNQKRRSTRKKSKKKGGLKEHERCNGDVDHEKGEGDRLLPLTIR